MATRHTVVLLLVSGCVIDGSWGTSTSGPATTAPVAVTGTAGPNDLLETVVTTNGTGTGVVDPTSCSTLVPSSPAARPCAVSIDALAVADCAAGGHAALLAGVGFATIEDAIAAASAGDTVQVCPGTWPGSLDVDAEITLAAADPTEGVTVIDAAGHKAVTVSATSTVIGLTVRNGSRNAGGGVLVTAPNVVLECMTIEDNDAEDGGGLSVDPGGTFVLRTSTLRNNVAGYGGGGAVIRGDATIEGSAFVDNFADNEGGGVAWGDWDPYTLVVSDTTFFGNTSGYQGGALDIGTWADDTVDITCSQFTSNASSYEAGAIEFGSWGSVTATISTTLFSDNTSGDGGAIEIGGWLDNGFTATFDDVSFLDNTAESFSGSAINIGSRVPQGHIDGTDVVFWRNTGGSAAIDLISGTTFDCIGCDAGTGADDNTPLDATSAGVDYAALPVDFSI